jgi:hypothetical protein
MITKNTLSLAYLASALLSCKAADTHETQAVAISASPATPSTLPQSASAESVAPRQISAAKQAKLAALNTLIGFTEAARKANLELTEQVNIKEDTDPNNLLGRPGQYVAKTNWKINGKDATLEVFANVEDAKARKQYVDGIGKASPLFLQYSFLNESRAALLRVPKQLTPAKAQEWDAMLQGFKPAE